VGQDTLCQLGAIQGNQNCLVHSFLLCFEFFTAEPAEIVPLGAGSNHSKDQFQKSEALAKVSPYREIVIPGKRCATRNPVPPSAGFKQFWIPTFAGITEERLLQKAQISSFLRLYILILPCVLGVFCG
jgi:hypothetical protein